MLLLYMLSTCGNLPSIRFLSATLHLVTVRCGSTLKTVEAADTTPLAFQWQYKVFVQFTS
jgi:hypothetical protein